MSNITIEIVSENNIEQCKELCNELMAFQKSKALITPEAFDFMNFETRMKKSYESAKKKQVIIAKDDKIPIGYVFSTIEMVDESVRHYYPKWMPKQRDSLGFYPHWLELPQNVACLNNLYIRAKYRSTGIGTKLFNRAIEWLGSFTDCDYTFVYVSNGNDKAYEYYVNNGFIYSHDVFKGFIKAAYKKIYK